MQTRSGRDGTFGAVPSPGLLRSALVGLKPAGTLRHLFGNLHELTRGEIIGEDPERNVEASRLRVDRTDGHGSYELYRLDRDLFILTIDCLFDSVREEIVPGEALLEVHICLRGRLTIQVPRSRQPIVAQGPCLLLLYQPAGADVAERLEAGMRYTGLSLYCRPSYLAQLLHRNGIAECALLRTIEAIDQRTVWHETLPLSAALHYIAMGLLQSPYQQGFRLLHSEAKALEILCQVLSPAPHAMAGEPALSTSTLVRQIDAARRILSSQFTPIPHIHDLARRVGVSESKLKRAFKEHFGVTVFEYGLQCRMRHALELLQADTVSICQVAEAVGYQHQTSFTAAFRDHFGFLPSEARTRRSGLVTQ
ncbi:MAG TPA: helix-turn-helix transcriptional regulator [Steroidobacteraceae bacterium]|jgi:AraC-like DNA-binding protein|nr:helix-turn-helix transcriptional regulator [Steroidobacteraceae bacterium]